jgi:CheY-like chemotaxis protein
MAGTILIVEDDSEIQELYAFMLEETGCRIIQACDGREALEKMEQQVPDLIVLDMLLEGMMGDAFFAEMKTAPRYADIPVVIASVLPRERCRSVLDQDRRVVYLRKPFPRDEFVEAVRAGLS